MTKYIFISGGVCSSLGKGVAASSLANLLEGHGYTISLVKIDPYLNVDAGTMNPYQHGEVYVTDDGAETDLDLGNYARFTNSILSRDNSITTGQIYQEVVRKEREGKYLGQTVQVIPHITDEIKQRICRVAEKNNVDIVIVEIGGTVGDIESVPFIEAARQFLHDFGKENVLYIHLTLVPAVSGGELKTKPTQHSVKELLELGIQPDILLCRCEQMLDQKLKQKIALFTNVAPEAVISAYNVKTSIYEIPLIFAKQNLDAIVLAKLGLKSSSHNKRIKAWEKMINTYCSSQKSVRIGIVGKYLDLHDSYKSIFEALIHGGIAHGMKVNIIKIDSQVIDAADSSWLKTVDGILIPGGFGARGTPGMIVAAKLAREEKLPYLGICLGMQIMVIEFARHVLGLADANSTEFNPQCKDPVISLLEEQEHISILGGTMRLGASKTKLKGNSLIRKIYGSEIIEERHRHRYEVTSRYCDLLERNGLMITGTTLDGKLVETVEWQGHPFGIGVQFHPEYKSKPELPHPLFLSFVGECIRYARL